MAQQLLVQRGDLAVVPELKKLAATGASPLGRLHALWTLEGLNKLDTELLLAMTGDKDKHIRVSALALCRAVVNRQPDAAYIQELAPLAWRSRQNCSPAVGDDVRAGKHRAGRSGTRADPKGSGSGSGHAGVAAGGVCRARGGISGGPNHVAELVQG